MDISSILETVMLICFGFAWPASIYKSWKTKTAKGKSLAFLVIVLCGYLSGITKVLITEGFSGFLFIPYMLNTSMLITELILYYRNVRFDRSRIC